MSDGKKEDQKILNSFESLFESLPDVTKEKIWTEFAQWRKTIQAEFLVTFNVKESKMEIENRDHAVTYFKEAFIFWAKKKPILPKTGGIEVIDLLKTRECNGQIARLSKQLKATDIEIEELNLDEKL